MTCDPEVVNFGNIFEESFASIWTGGKYIEFRKRIKEGDLPSFCKTCYID
ncbi:MAG: SPASM domain-containing protein [Candidatus Krumholzibacteria bacterium]|nr:SPASM domain-containing protein [Candidatus Krumholzibacteria bacterium]